MFGYYIEQSKKLNLTANNNDAANEEFSTSIKGFKTREEAQQALQEAEQEIIQSRDYRIVDSRIYEYDRQ
ncbi:MAG: hypothetical protein WBF90_24290 [Rivularia sp. (in: cyanobacteria)]